MLAHQTTLFPSTQSQLEAQAWLEDVLRRNGSWLTAAEIARLSCLELSDRAIRALASESPWIISGQRGYKHITAATPQEIHHAAAWLESQAKKMSDRACHIRRQAHCLLG